MPFCVHLKTPKQMDGKTHQGTSAGESSSLQAIEDPTDKPRASSAPVSVQ